ncbi:MAG: peptidyl-prolyl cis-trans isomerase [Deltaproteobacteria bacterium]|nr:peptidyl-prolyl cis-trans isomerase [Deltaproteobacteria bacterium]
MMRPFTCTFSVLLLSSLVVACGGESPPPGDGAEASDVTTTGDVSQEDQGTIVAEVSGVKISAQEFEAAAAREAPRTGEPMTEEQKREVLDKLVRERMLYLEAKKAGIDRDPKVQKVMVNTLLRQDVYAGVRNSDFTPDDLRAYYEEHKEEFVVPEKVQVRRLYVKAGASRSAEEAKALIEELHAQVTANPTRFAEVASESSEDPYRRRGGDLGYLATEGKPGIDQAVVDQAFELEVGEISEPFEAGGGWHVVTVTGKRERVERTFEQMKGSVLRKVKNERYKDLYREYVEKISGSYEVIVHDDILAELEVQPARRLTLGPGAPGIRPKMPEEGEVAHESPE